MVLKVQYKTVFKSASYLIIIKTTLEHLLLRHHLCCANYQVYLLNLFMTSHLCSTNMLIDLLKVSRGLMQSLITILVIASCLRLEWVRQQVVHLYFILTMTFPSLKIYLIPFYLIRPTRIILDFTRPEISFLSMLNVETLFSNFV